MKEEKSMESDYLFQLVEFKQPEEKNKSPKATSIENKINGDSAWTVTQSLV